MNVQARTARPISFWRGVGRLRPDLVVVLRDHTHRIIATHVVGTPDLVIEILSPSTRAQDLVRKREYYMRAGVPGYWIIDPESRTMEVIRSDGRSRIVRDAYQWEPEGTSTPFSLELERLFR